MPALPNVASTLRVTLKYALTDSDPDVINRIFVSYSGSAPTDAELATFAGAVADAWDTNLASLYNEETALQEVLVEDLTSDTASVGNAVVEIVGTRSGAALTAGVAVVISEKIARRYRGGHPRVYLGAAIASDIATSNEWNTDFLTAMATGWDNFIVAVKAAGWSGAGTLTPVNVSYYSGFTNHTYPSGRVRPIPTLRGTPLTDPILTYAVNIKCASQRRRNQQSA